MARTSPQIPIMEFGFPIKVMVGFFFLGLLMVIMSDRITSFVQGLDGLFSNLLRAVWPMYQWAITHQTIQRPIIVGPDARQCAGRPHHPHTDFHARPFWQ